MCIVRIIFVETMYDSVIERFTRVATTGDYTYIVMMRCSSLFSNRAVFHKAKKKKDEINRKNTINARYITFSFHNATSTRSS